VRVERETVRDEWTIVGARRGRHGRTPARSATGSSSSSCARARSAGAPVPCRVRRRRRQRRAADAGRVHALRRGAGPVPREWP
jgi:hypothetical protein